MVVEIFILIGLICIFEYFLKKSKTNRMKSIASLPKLPIIGCVHLMLTLRPENLNLKIMEYSKRYGNSFYGWIFGYLVVATSEPKYVESILSNSKHISKNIIYKMMMPWLGDGLLIGDGTNWRTMRKIVTPTFHFSILEQFVEVFDRQSLKLVEKLKPFAVANMENGQKEKALDIYPLVAMTTLDIIIETAMGVKIETANKQSIQFREQIKEVIKIYSIRSMRPHLVLTGFFKFFAPSLYKKQRNAIDEIHKFTKYIINQRRSKFDEKIQSKNSSDDNNNNNEFGIKQRMVLLDVLLLSTIDGKPLDNHRIITEVNTVIFAGHDTTGTSVAFTLWLLSRHPTVQKRLYNEIKERFNGDDRLFVYSDLQDLPYLNCVIKESLRLYPSVPLIGRYLKEECHLGDITLPAGSNVSILLSQILRDPRVYPEPDTFKPERHLIENAPSVVNSFRFVPFSAGPRNCLGQRFAQLEMKCIIIRILQNYELFASGEDLQLTIKLVLSSENGVQIGIRPRLH